MSEKAHKTPPYRVLPTTFLPDLGGLIKPLHLNMMDLRPIIRKPPLQLPLQGYLSPRQAPIRRREMVPDVHDPPPTATKIQLARPPSLARLSRPVEPERADTGPVAVGVADKHSDHGPFRVLLSWRAAAGDHFGDILQPAE